MDEAKVKRNVNPNENANFLSKLFFLWTGPIFMRGMQPTPMAPEELCDPLSEDTSEALGDLLEENWLKELERAKLAERQPNLLWAVLRTFWVDYLIKYGMMHIVNEIILRLGQPLLLGILLNYFSLENEMSLSYILEIAGYLTLVNLLSTIGQNHFGLAMFHYGMKARVSVCSLIYRKALRLSKTALGETAPGQVVNLLSNDVSRLDIVCFFLHYMWSAPLCSIFVIYYVYSKVGYAGLIGVLSVFIFIPMQSYLGKLTSRFRLQTAYRTDERVRLMDEIISGIQVIKMYAWEKPFARLIENARVKELNILKKSSYVRGVYMTFNLFNTRCAMYATMMALSLFGEPLNPADIFVCATYFVSLSFTLSGMFVRGVGEIAESLVSMKRITKFLMLEEHSGYTNSRKVAEDLSTVTNAGAVELVDVTAKWNAEVPEPTLLNVSVYVKPVTLAAIVGPVGCGKSSLLQVLLGELPVNSGKVKVSGRVSYAGQEAWVFAASVRKNITFGLPFNRIRYNEVVRACALLSDFKQWPDGDRTIVGERGTSLSGGQRARINLARAVYKDADVYLLDDPLSAVDTHVGKHLFEECINGFLKDKTRILVTHQLQYLEAADNIVLLVNGAVQVQGTFQELVHSDSEFAHLLASSEEAEEEKKEETLEEELLVSPALSRLSRKGSSISNRSGSRSSRLDVDSIEELAAPTQMEEIKPPSGSVLYKYFSSGANFFLIATLATFFILAQTAASICDYWVSIWTTQDQFLRKWQEEATELYGNDTNSIGLGLNATIDSWGVIHDPAHNGTLLLSPELCQYVHSALIVSLFAVAISRSIIFYNICISCSLKLHNNMFTRVCQTLLSFYHTNPSGRILNRFSKDLGSIDELLPKALLDAGQIIIYVFGCIIVTITINYLFLLPVAVIAVFALGARIVFLRSSRNIKRIEGVTRSPVFTHLNATLQGLTTIRAYNAEEILKQEFDHHQNLHTSAWYLFISTSTAFGFTLDTLCFILITAVTFILLLVETGLSGGQVGLAITQTMALSGMVQWGMRQSAEVSNQLTAVERVLEYTDLETEPNLETGPMEKEGKEETLKTWPNSGKIEFSRMSLFYKKDDPPAINDLSLLIQPGEKVGIIGRTGAGKTSLIAAMFRLAPVEGKVLIDDVDTSRISLHRLRSHVSIIPQEPVLFSGTIRRNLDPFQSYSDAALWQALEEVELKDALPFGLDTPVQDGGSNFSVGQKQLLCLARAILRNNKILLLDEATASVDPQTDALIQHTIRIKFRDCTVCTIAHRLNTIMDSDKVLVMDFGKMVEFDTPYNLLQRPQGFFTKMVEQTGHAMADQLRKIAEESRKS